ncbi:MAG TPA: TonB-dependent receptor [Pyrinomonadaceae bacterium]|jgi:hypothetical protein
MEKTLLMLERNSFSSNLSTSKNKINKRVVKLSSLLVMSLLLFLSPILVSAQAVSGVTGVITDPSGAVVPGVQVVLLDTKTSRELTTTSNDQGVYVFNNVSPGGGYRLTFTAQGFQTSVLNDVQLGIGRTETHNAELIAGNVSATVEIESTAGDVTLNTTDASVGNVIGEQQLRELPIQIRSSPAALIGLQPGVIGNNVGTGNANRVGSVAGSRTDQGNVTVDGIDANDVASGQAFATVANAPIDSIQEFRAVSANPNASEGRSSGGQVQLATKSGTNDYHGSARIYYRSDKFAANEFFNNRNGVPRPLLQRRQFGGSLGGPLHFLKFGEGGPVVQSGRDRLFFFFDYEGRRDDSQVSASRTVPLQHYREGRIAYIRATDPSGAACPATSRLDNNPNCIGFLTQAQVAALDPRGIGANAALLSFINSRYPQANDLTGGDGLNTGLFRFNAPVVRADNTYTTRIDGNISDEQKIFGRLTVNRRNSTNVAQLFPGDADQELFQDKSYAFAIGHSWVISPKFFNQATFGISRQQNYFLPPSSPAFPNIFGGGGVLTAPFAGLTYQDRIVTVPTIRDDATWTTGAHTFQFGGQFKPIRQNPSLTSDFNSVTLGLGGLTSQLNANLRPSGTPGSTAPPAIRAGSTATYDAAFAYLLGRVALVSTNFVYDPQGNASVPGTGRSRNYAYNEYELYAQDNWKVRSDLTLNLGVRWHLYPAPYETNGFQTGSNIVDADEYLARRVENAANGVAGVSAEPIMTYSLIGKANNGRPFYETDKNNFAPRIGFAYNPSFKGGLMGAIFGERKTSLRGGASIIYDRPGGAMTFLIDQSTYLFDSSAVTNFGNTDARVALLNDPRFTGLTSLPIQNVAPAVGKTVSPFVTNGVPNGLAANVGNYVIDKNFQIPYSYQWSFGVQRELPFNMILDVTYVGRRGRKLWTQSDIGQVLNFKDPASGQFLFDALNATQAQIQAQVAAGISTPVVTPQPWIENQARLGSNGATFCPTPAFNCTQFLTNNFREQLRTGGTAQFIRALYQNGLLRPNVGMSAQFALNDFVTNKGYSNYDGMLVSLQKRFSQGFTYDVNYTWSHAIDNQSSITNTGFGGTLQNALNPDASRANADFDIRHLFNANGIWELPIGRQRAIGTDMPRWLDAVIGGWNVAGIITARSGLPINAASGAFTLQLGLGNPSYVVGDRSAFKGEIHDETGGIQYFADPAAARAALRYPRHGEIGSRNAFRSPGFMNIDMALSKKFQMPWSENHRLTLRAEAFNLTNSVYFDSPASLGVESATFGRITGTLTNAREVQFALRYDF